MKASQKYLFLVALYILFNGVVLAQTFTQMKIDVKPENDGMKISWVIGSEDGDGCHYQIFRSTGTEQFFLLADKPRGTSSFNDNNLFKTTGRFFRYQVIALHGETIVAQSAIVGASYNTSSAAKRTWGSIKAMFR